MKHDYVKIAILSFEAFIVLSCIAILVYDIFFNNKTK